MKKTTTELKRRDFLGNITKAGILGTLGVSPLSGLATALQEREQGAAENHSFLSMPYLQVPTKDSITIRWLTESPCYSWVEYGETSLNQKAHSVTAGLVNANDRIHEVAVRNLKPSTTYQYKVVAKKIEDFQPYKLTYGDTIESPVFEFKIPEAQPKNVRWLIMNDIHDRPESIPHLMNLRGPEACDFVFFNGDMFDYQTDEQQIIDHLLTPCTQSFASSIPFLFVRGNHETRGKFARQLPQYFSNPGNQFYFSFEHGPVYSLVLDTGEDKPDSAEVYAGIVDSDNYRREQALWLEKEIQKPAFQKAKFRVVMMHIPPFYSGDWHGTLHCRELFAPLFEKGKIDLVIAGHTHKYGVHKPVAGQHSYPVIIGGGPKEGQRTLLKIQADAKALHMQMLDDSGKEVGNYVLETRV